MRKARSDRSARGRKPGKVKARARQYFATVANRWDRMREDFFDETIADSIVKASGAKPESTIVDVGCGTGFLTQHLAKLTQHAGKIVGVDLSPSMLQVARDNLAKLGLLESVEFRVGDAEKLPVDDSFADAVVGNMVLHHCQRPRRVVFEMARVLKLAKVKEWFHDANLEDVKVELARTKCCGISLHGRKAEIGIFIASGSKPKRHPLR